MSELKTLKEMNTYVAAISTETDRPCMVLVGNWEDNGERMIYPAELKELGITWIKAFTKGECHTDFAADGRNGQENIIEWIQHVLNITEEDLK